MLNQTPADVRPSARETYLQLRPSHFNYSFRSFHPPAQPEIAEIGLDWAEVTSESLVRAYQPER